MDVLLNGNSCIDQLENGHNRITIPHTHSSIEIKVISMEKMCSAANYTVI